MRDKERSQACLVGAWISIEDKGGKTERLIRISNASDAPVYDISVRVPGMRWEQHLSELPPKTTTTLDARPPSHRTSRATSATVGVWMFQASVTRETRSEDPPPELEFRDGSGKLWRRPPDGKLREIHERTFSTLRSSLKLPFLEISADSKEQRYRAK
ncbi:hypothetical protein [Streptomyces longisporoflavus]|uniref:hypothetical protein n=1 Tax=Streptomyces longisporoflavus TaxID=28044 RepID=UPI001E3C3E44|nr:hypothetical protein [Streptomyces longisporoflavus]